MNSGFKPAWVLRALGTEQVLAFAVFQISMWRDDFVVASDARKVDLQGLDCLVQTILQVSV